MGTRTICLGLLLTAVMALAPRPAWGQPDSGGTGLDYAEPDPVFPLPLFSGFRGRPERGGFYAAGEFLLWRQTNPIKEQPIAVRGFVDTNAGVQQIQNFFTDFFNGNPGPPLVPGQFFGSGALALDTQQVSGPNSYQPGFGTTLGWKFENGIDIEFNWKHLLNKKTSATAGPIGPTLNAGAGGADSFLFAPVYNFSNDFNGPINKINVSFFLPGVFVVGPPNPPGFPLNWAFLTTQGPVGIWNGAQLMTIQFTQRYDEFELIGRIPIYESPRCRFYGIIGPRAVQLWEQFWWRTVDQAVLRIRGNITAAGVFVMTIDPGDGGESTPLDQATYTNVVSNRLYGPVFGCGTDLYLGRGFGLGLELRAAPLIDVVKERAKYEIGDKHTAASRNRTDYTMAEEVDAKINLTWYPIEGVELRFGYDVMNFFNTVSSPRPIDFNMGSLTPTWEKGTYRLMEGFEAGIGITF
jgi:hypothetical protein